MGEREPRGRIRIRTFRHKEHVADDDRHPVFARPRAIYEKDPEGDETCFAACADVERGWLAEGWSDRERRERG